MLAQAIEELSPKEKTGHLPLLLRGVDLERDRGGLGFTESQDLPDPCEGDFEVEGEIETGHGRSALRPLTEKQAE